MPLLRSDADERSQTACNEPRTMTVNARLPRASLEGHLTREVLQRALSGIVLGALPRPVLIDCTKMTGYELDARHGFVDWIKKNGTKISRVAILTDNRIWWMVISAMSLASGRAMRGFGEESAAVAWAMTGAAREDEKEG